MFEFSGKKFFLLLVLSAIAWWAWKRANVPPPIIITGFVLTAEGNRPIKGAWVVPAVHLDKSVYQLDGGYIVDYTSGCGAGDGVATNANGQFFASIPYDKIHLDENNVGTPGIAYVYALGFETAILYPTEWETPIRMKPTGVAFDDVIRESTKLRNGPCATGNQKNSADSELGAAVFRHKSELFCALPQPTMAQLYTVANGSLKPCNRQKSNANARACLRFSEMLDDVRAKTTEELISKANQHFACATAADYIGELTND